MRDSISEYQFSDKADSSTGIEVLDWFGLNPLGELVDCYQHMGEIASACSQRADHIQPPYCEGLDKWYGL